MAAMAGCEEDRFSGQIGVLRSTWNTVNRTNRRGCKVLIPERRF
jgi:hypothetical protein